jgi:hypothetical protein
MHGRGARPSVLLLPVLLAASALLGSSPVAAQSTYVIGRPEITRPDKRPVETSRSRPRPSLPRPLPADAEPDDAETRETGIVTSEEKPRAKTPKPAVILPPVANGDEEPDPDVGDGAERIAAAAKPPRDGVLAEPAPVLPRDGDLPAEADEPLIDGSLAAVDDLAEEVVLAENGQFGIDEPRFGRPINGRRRGPYEPAGIRFGSFVVFPEGETGGRYTDNVFRTRSDKRADIAAELKGGLRIESNWRRHSLALQATGLKSYWGTYESENDSQVALAALARIDLGRRTNIEADAAYDFGQEQRGGLNVPSGAGARAGVIHRRAGLAVNHAFNRLRLQLRGAIRDTIYGSVLDDDPASGLVSLVDNRSRSYRQNEAAVRVGYELSPGLVAFFESAWNERKHAIADPGDGIMRDSEGTRHRVGIVTELRGTLWGEISIGQARQRPNDRRLSEVTGWTLDSQLVWQPTGLTEIKLYASSDIAETTASGIAGALTRTAGIEARHALRRHVILIAGLSYAVADYGPSVLDESETRGRVGLEYYLSREAAVLADYERIRFEANASERSHVDNIVRAGLRVRR